jgi:hypothetical protein
MSPDFLLMMSTCFGSHVWNLKFRDASKQPEELSKAILPCNGRKQLSNFVEKNYSYWKYSMKSNGIKEKHCMLMYSFPSCCREDGNI